MQDEISDTGQALREASTVSLLRAFRNSVTHTKEIEREREAPTRQELLEKLIEGLYYDGEISIEVVEGFLGPEKAKSIDILKQHLDRDYLEKLSEKEE